ncbi:MAG: MotA/TolQ/ExbB proton channel family protein [Gemmatimonadetes bacterium]|nr:MotA/TolQ/ExbB proton channel family protein [Gemmatimonadota bacterium]
MSGGEYALLQLFQDGGIMMYPLLAASLLALAVILAKGYALWAAERQSRGLLGRVEALGRQGRLGDALELAQTTPGPVAAILAEGLRRLHDRRTRGRDLEKAVQTTGSIELGFLERGLGLLATISSVAPLLGFLGTVMGMISAFGAIADAGQIEASLVAGGIKVALITTAAGLTIAVPVNIAYNFFVTRIDKLIVRMEESAASVLTLLWDLEKTATGAAGPRPAAD